MNAQEFASMAERLHDTTDEDRFELLSEASTSPIARQRLREAFLVLSSASAIRRPTDESHPSPDAIALELSRGRVPREAVSDWNTVEWLLASLAAMPEGDDVGRASAATRRSMRAIARPASRRRALWIWLPALAAGATAALMLVVWAPAREPWAHSLKLSRGQVWGLSDAVATQVRATVETGRLSDALFELPQEPSRLERSESVLRGQPLTESPRWEAVVGNTPEFRWTVAGDAGEFEIMLLDADRSVVWSALTREATRLVYPADRPPLKPGATYYWKVNRLDLGPIVASPYVAFRVLGDTERRDFDAEFRKVRSHAFLRGSVLDRHGLYSRAAAAFEVAASEGHQQEISLAARRAVRNKQGLPE